MRKFNFGVGTLGLLLLGGLLYANADPLTTGSFLAGVAGITLGGFIMGSMVVSREVIAGLSCSAILLLSAGFVFGYIPASQSAFVTLGGIGGGAFAVGVVMHWVDRKAEPMFMLAALMVASSVAVFSLAPAAEAVSPREAYTEDTSVWGYDESGMTAEKKEQRDQEQEDARKGLAYCASGAFTASWYGVDYVKHPLALGVGALGGCAVGAYQSM